MDEKSKPLLIGMLGILSSLCFFGVYRMRNPGWEIVLPSAATIAASGVVSLLAFIGWSRALEDRKYQQAAAWTFALLVAMLPFFWLALGDKIGKIWTR
jgi:hypothetical protein